MKPICIVTATNDLYAPHLAVMFTSIILNHTSPEPLRFYIIEGENLSRASKAGLVQSLCKYNQRPIFLKIDTNLYKNFPVSFLTVEAYYRLSIAELLPKKIHKVIYLDCDIIINDDISKLWEIDLHDCILAAASDPWVLEEECERLNIPKNSGYFNSGVMVINLDKWRAFNMQKKALEFMNFHMDKLFYLDQNVLNALFYQNRKELDSKWNYLPFMIIDGEPSLIHYASAHYKPWIKSPNHFRALDYYKYRSYTDWNWQNGKNDDRSIAIALKVMNGPYYMSAENGGGQGIMGNTTHIGDQETFWLYFLDPIQNLVCLKTFDKRFFVTAEGEGGKNLVANRTQLGTWEIFRFKNLQDNHISLQAINNGQYVCFENGGNHIITANRDKCGPWESFNIELLV